MAESPNSERNDDSDAERRGALVGPPRWVKASWVTAFVVVVLVVILLIVGGHGPGRHFSGGTDSSLVVGLTHR